jgi:hypothetical protein
VPRPDVHVLESCHVAATLISPYLLYLSLSGAPRAGVKARADAATMPLAVNLFIEFLSSGSGFLLEIAQLCDRSKGPP